jgi:tetratricopeptide (TPR) repeat protein
MALVPRRALAPLWLGRALARRGDHAGCAANLGAAARAEPDFRPPSSDWPLAIALGLELGICQARAGAFEDAERTFTAMVERGATATVVFERLADVQMALGRLDDARIAVERALAGANLSAGPSFALAVVLDRDERPAEARQALETAVARDVRLIALGAAARPYAPLADESYYLGLALEAVGDRSRALYHWRRYLARAGDGPWAARGRSHLAALSRDRTGDDLEARGSAATPADLAAARRLVHGAGRELEACVGDAPRLLVRVALTRVVAGGEPAGGDRPRPGVRVSVVEQDGVGEEQAAAAVACVETAAARLASSLPRLRGARGAHVTLELSLIGR